VFASARHSCSAAIYWPGPPRCCRLWTQTQRAPAFKRGRGALTEYSSRCGQDPRRRTLGQACWATVLNENVVYYRERGRGHVHKGAGGTIVPVAINPLCFAKLP
jgi:hypothetical protein